MYKKNIVITRPSSRSSVAVKLVEDNGFVPIVVPTLELELVNSSSLKELIKNIRVFDWLIFTSVSSLDSIFKFYPDFIDLLNDNTRIGVIGHKTAEVCEDYGLSVDLIPKNYTAEGLLDSFKSMNIKNKNIAIPRTFTARNILPEGLKDMGANVFLAETYKSSLPKDTSSIDCLIEDIFNDKIDSISFTSPLTVKNLINQCEDKDALSRKLSCDVLTASIGPITYNTLKEYNISSFYPETYTVKDMLELLFSKL